MNTDIPKKKKHKWIVWVVVVVAFLLVAAILRQPQVITITEDQMNSKLAEGVGQTEENPLVSSEIDLQEGVGTLMMSWEQGQELSADIVVSSSGNLLQATNIDVEGAGVLDGFFEGAANLVLTNLFTQITVSQNNLDSIEIHEDRLEIYYSR